MKNIELINIIEKADFIYNNSGIICSKLSNDETYEDILNYLQVFLLCDLPINKLEEICDVLKNNNTKTIFENNYNSAIKIIFSVCELINESNYNINGKNSLKDKLRKYMEHLKFDESIRALNNGYVKVKKETN